MRNLFFHYKLLVSMLALAALPAVVLLPACDGKGSTHDFGNPDGGVDASSGADSGFDEDGCRILTLGRSSPRLNPGFLGAHTGLRYPVAPNLGGPPADVLLVELFDSNYDGLPPLVPGSFDLSLAPDNDLATCQHCVWMVVNEESGADPKAIYFQTKGTLTLSQVTDPLGNLFAGSTSRVVLSRATITNDGHSQLTPGGDCVSISGANFDTTPTPGKACLSADDCGDPLQEICDPVNNVCAQPQCDIDTNGCPAGKVCLVQTTNAFYGACYEACHPAAEPPGCGPDERCVQSGFNPQNGFCKHIGDAAVGAACRFENNSASCAGDAVCSADTLTCSPTCDFFDAVPGCSDGSLCSLFGACEPPSAGLVIELGTSCGDEGILATGCAPDGEAFRGICFHVRPTDPLICEKVCLLGAVGGGADRGCGDGQFCALRFSSGLGICQPLPVCGDGKLGEINEVCDDGNTNSGDACSADCKTVGYQYICTHLTSLQFGTDVQGDTKAGLDGFKASLQVGTARAKLFTLTPPGRGRLHIRMTSQSGQVISLRTDCAEASSEFACVASGPLQDPQGPRDLFFQITDANPQPLTVIVSAQNVLEEGPFTIRAEFDASTCGDGIVTGNEACDDGNNEGGDGCSADCSQIEYTYYCDQAPLLKTDQLNTGDTADAPRLFDPSCTGVTTPPTGPDRLYHFVAPANKGTLHLQMTGISFHEIIVFSGCGSPSEISELACVPNGQVGVQQDIPLAANQEIFVVVSYAGFPGLPTGYSLQATWTDDPPQ